jgi:hypothetical protein
MSRIFISYSHDSPEHIDRVLALSDRLRLEGIDCYLDQYEESPPEGWPNWCLNQVEEAEFVLIICTETYNRRFRGKEQPKQGLGVAWEGFVITQQLYEAAAKNSKFIPVVFSTEDQSHIPIPLRGAARYDLSKDDRYDALYFRLTHQPLIEKPALGKIRKKASSLENNAQGLPRRQDFRERFQSDENSQAVLRLQISEPVQQTSADSVAGTSTLQASRLLSPRRSEHIAVFVFGVLFISLLIVLALFVPAPTAFQYTIFRIVLALAAAGIAAFVPGVINVTVNERVRAGGAIAVFVMVYFFSPAKLVSDSSTFPLTVYVHGEDGPQELVLRNSGKVVLRLGVEPRSEPIGADGQAFFRAIPISFRKQYVPVWVESDDFEVVDHVQQQLAGPSIDVTVRRKSGRVSGRIEEDRSAFVPIPGAEVHVAGITTKSGGAGEFDIVIPGNRLQPQLDLDVSASGYLPLHTTIIPNSNAAVIKLRRSR